MIHLSVIIPVRNEAEHIAEVLDRLLAQNYDPDKLEILVVDGLSEDQTPQIVQKYVQEHPHIVRYLENPKRLSSAARNVGIMNAKGEAVLIVDGHCIIDNNDMLRNVSEAFERTGADCLGRPQPLEMKDATSLQWAIATARRSPLGHHPDSFIYSGQAQFSPASSVAVAYRMSVFEKVGTFDESFDACEDVEMNTRIDAAGLTCYFEPAIAVRYVPRKTLGGLQKQMNRYGRGRVRLWRKHRHTFSWKSFAPGLFVAWIYFSLIFCTFDTGRMLLRGFYWAMFGVPYIHAWTIPSHMWAIGIGLYWAVVIAESVRLARQQKRWDILPNLLFVFTWIHCGYGEGVLREFFSYKGRVDSKNEIGGYKDRFWYPRIWDGMTLRAWLKLLKAGKYRVAPIRWGMALIITGLAALFNSPNAWLQRLIYGKRIRETTLAGAPIFIIGHWRSGTTLLHEYMIRDPRFSFADTYACFVPEHFIVSRFTLRPLAALLMPKKRPIDNMTAGFDRPQEDEFALAAMGLPSPYRNIIFSNNGLNIDTEYLTLRNVSAEDRKTWLDGLDTFLKTLTFQNPGKRIVLKSPPHTGRIKTLLERYPDAKFIHIHRNPYSIFPSTYNLWMRFSKDEGAQHPTGKGMEDYIFDSLNIMYDAFEEDIKNLPANQFCDIGYKELTSTPVETLEKIYRTLELEGFGEVRSIFEQYADSQKEYKKNKFSMEPELKSQIAQRWKRYFERYGYEQ